MAKGKLKSIFVKMMSEAGTGFFYVTRKNPKNTPERLVLRKVRPRIPHSPRVFTHPSVSNPFSLPFPLFSISFSSLLRLSLSLSLCPPPFLNLHPHLVRFGSHQLITRIYSHPPSLTVAPLLCPHTSVRPPGTPARSLHRDQKVQVKTKSRGALLPVLYPDSSRYSNRSRRHSDAGSSIRRFQTSLDRRVINARVKAVVVPLGVFQTSSGRYAEEADAECSSCVIATEK